MNNIDFTRELIKGRIAETIFEQMFRESGMYTILRSGYEYTLPELAQYQHLAEIKAVIANIRNAPDFVLISQDKKEVYLVEVKFCTRRDPKIIKEIVDQTLKIWNPSWLFVASPDGFFFDTCSNISIKNGEVGELYSKWVEADLQMDYLKILKQFEPRASEIW
jgi:hypothetical protein